jgi:hypothetical protein
MNRKFKRFIVAGAFAGKEFDMQRQPFIDCAVPITNVVQDIHTECYELQFGPIGRCLVTYSDLSALCFVTVFRSFAISMGGWADHFAEHGFYTPGANMNYLCQPADIAKNGKGTRARVILYNYWKMQSGSRGEREGMEDILLGKENFEGNFPYLVL